MHVKLENLIESVGEFKIKLEDTVQQVSTRVANMETIVARPHTNAQGSGNKNHIEQEVKLAFCDYIRTGNEAPMLGLSSKSMAVTLSSSDGGGTVGGLASLAYFILLSYMIPISLYVTVRLLTPLPFLSAHALRSD